MGQDPNQPYPGQYGQQPGNVPPQGNYQGGYQQQGAYPPPQNPGYPPPNTGYQQQQPGTGYNNQYQQQPPYTQPGAGTQYNTGHPNGPSTMGMDPNTAAGLSYLAIWVTGLIFFLLEKQNRFVRFNAMQSIVLSVAAIVASIVITVFSTILTVLVPLLGCLFGLLSAVVWLGFLVFWIICMVNAFQGKYFKIPFLGDLAERWAGSAAPPSYS